MIVTADWVLPVIEPPIRDGAVAVREGVIVEVGHAADVCARWLDDQVEDLTGCILAPGLVNAHTHLALTVAKGLAPPGAFHPWLSTVTKVVLGLSHEEFGHSAAAGALESLRCGVTSVGDIVYGLESLEAAASVGVGGVFFWEVLGLTPADLQGLLERRGYPREPGDVCAVARSNIRVGLSPHAAYSSGPDLLRSTYALARERHEVFAIHVSEAAGEVELVQRGTGPFAAQAERLAHGFEVPGTTPIRYLDSLGVLGNATCIHAVHATSEDIALLAKKVRAVVLCPRSNAYLGNGVPPVAEMRAAGVPLALGTDSSASNTDLDLFEEARAVRAIDETIDAPELLEMMTVGAARALGLERLVGEISHGASADLVAVRPSEVLQRPDQVAEAILARGSVGVERVMTQGVWRIVDGAPTFRVGPIRDAANAARDHALRILASPKA